MAIHYEIFFTVVCGNAFIYMKIFKGFNQTGEPCPVCQTNSDEPCTLIPIAGSNEDGGMNYRALPIHVDCLDLWYDPDGRIIVQRIL